MEELNRLSESVRSFDKYEEDQAEDKGHPHSCVTVPCPELRLVLAGWRGVGKKVVGNTILGKEAFLPGAWSAQCVKSTGEVAGRQVTVVVAPGWWQQRSATDSPQLYRWEVMQSVSLCAPGPHVILVVIDLSSPVTRMDTRAVEEHVELLGEKVWSHVMLLFTGADSIGDMTTETYVETEGKALQHLVEKCGNRYHVLNVSVKGDNAQVSELLKKVDELVKEASHFEMDVSIWSAMDVKKKTVLEKAKRRIIIRSEPTGQSPLLSELRVVLFGGRATGKTSAGNIILDKQVFKDEKRTALCVTNTEEVCGRKVTVVDTPGWWKNYCAISTPELDKQEMECSVCMCPPGPHAFLLTINIDSSFTETNRKAIEEHVELISPAVWMYTVVLFTRGERLGNATIEEYIESEGKALQRLVEKCGSRYHLLKNKDMDNHAAVSELLEKVEEMAARNCGHFVTEQNVSQRLKRRMSLNLKAEDAKDRMRRQAIHSVQGRQIPDLRIALLGAKGAGKSSAANTIMGREEFEVGVMPNYCMKKESEADGRRVVLVDTPGWWRHYSVQETMESDKREIRLSVTEYLKEPHCVLLVVDLDTSFREEDRRAVEEHMLLISEAVWRHTVVLFTCRDWLGDTTVEQRVESEGRALKWLVEKCDNRYHVLNNKDMGDRAQVKELLEKVEQMVAGNEGKPFIVEPQQKTEEQRGQKQARRTTEEEEEDIPSAKKCHSNYGSHPNMFLTPPPSEPGCPSHGKEVGDVLIRMNEQAKTKHKSMKQLTLNK